MKTIDWTENKFGDENDKMPCKFHLYSCLNFVGVLLFVFVLEVLCCLRSHLIVEVIMIIVGGANNKMLFYNQHVGEGRITVGCLEVPFHVKQGPLIFMLHVFPVFLFVKT